MSSATGKAGVTDPLRMRPVHGNWTLVGDKSPITLIDPELAIFSLFTCSVPNFVPIIRDSGFAGHQFINWLGIKTDSG